GLVGSIIVLASFLNTTMTGSTQRFLSYSKATNNLNSVFPACIILHFILGIIVVVLLEIGGFLFLDLLNIHPDRKAMANFVFHCVVANTFFSIISTPYAALINAYEDMSFMAVISIIESFAKLGIALILFVIPYDRLGTYAFAIMILAIFMRILQSFFCKIRYPKVSFSRQFINKNLIREILSFSGWNFFMVFCNTISIHSLPILINQFFGTAINAVFSITNQITMQISSFSYSLLTASAPQVVSGFAHGNQEHSKYLAVFSCKTCLFFVSLFGIPLILNIDYVLFLWLRQVPEYLPVFCCIALVNEIAINLSRGLDALVEGKGFVRGFKTALGFASLIALPIAYVLLRQGHSPYAVYVGISISNAFWIMLRIYFAHRHAGLSIPHYLKQMSKLLAVVLVAFLCAGIVIFPLPTPYSPLPALIFSTSLSSLVMCSGFWLALDAKEREFAKGLWRKARDRVRKSGQS
ncbi:MAG: hypothetical protein FWH22_10315, partial [Fibromonadales bacterium]|nr:hypothetical protein [Fibromonadales bacterium]